MSFPRYPAYKDSGVEWLGQIPSHWSVAPLKSVVSCNDEVLVESTPEDFEIEYVEISGVDVGKGIVETSTLPFKAAASRARRIVRDGDVLVSTVRTYLRAIAPVRKPAPNLIASTGFAVLRPKQIDSAYLGYTCQAEHWISEVIARSAGVSYPAINASDLISLAIGLPPLVEQAAIAGFLDRETAKIDALVAEQEQLITLLKEKRQAVISHAVTKGLDPSVPMKDSGVEWLGEVPAHWSVTPLRWVASCRSGEGLAATEVEASPDEAHTVPVVGGNGLMGYTDAATVDHQVLAVGRVGALCGNVHVVSPPAWITDNALIVDPDLCVFDIHFLSAVLRIRNLNDIASKTAQPLITGTQVSDQRLPAPPIDEQRAIVEHLSNLTTSYSGLINEAVLSIELLRERRSALISAAVTGQIDVRGLAPAQEQAACPPPPGPSRSTCPVAQLSRNE